jgi:hypothetical protein
MENKVCKACLIEKSISSFHSCRQCRDGKLNICKICKNQGRRVDKSDKIHIFNKTWRNKSNDYNLRWTTKEDYEKMWILLKLIGYDITGNIHKQFVDKINLKINKPIKYRKKNQETQPRYLPNGQINPLSKNPPKEEDLEP